MASSKSIVTIGGVNSDLIMRVPRMPKLGESLVGHDFKVALGGKAADQAVAAARLGVPSFLLSSVGSDHFGVMLEQQLANYGVSTEYVNVVPDAASGVAMIIIDEMHRQNSIVVTPGPYVKLDGGDILRAHRVISGAFALLFTLEVPVATINAAADFAHIHGILTVLDPGPVSSWNPEVLRYIDIITPNETEIEAITEISVDDFPSAEVATRKLLASGIKTVILKMGGRGALAVDASGVRYVPPVPVDVVDPTAAGDAFNAGLVVALSEGKDMDVALKFASCAAALAVRKVGAASSLPTREEVDELFINVSLSTGRAGGDGSGHSEVWGCYQGGDY